MKEYDIKITEVLEKTVQVQAESREDNRFRKLEQLHV